MAKPRMENWPTFSINKKTTKLVEQLAALITVKEGRLNKCSKHEAIHKAATQMIGQLKRKGR